MLQVQAKHTKITKLTAAGLAGVFLNPKCGSSDRIWLYSENIWTRGKGEIDFVPVRLSTLHTPLL